MKTTKKALSVLLAVIMIMSSMSVCFGTFSFAAGKDVDVTALANALKNETVKKATFTGSANNYLVEDPDGKILAAVEAYFAVVDAMANKNPTVQKPSSGTSDIAQKGESSDKTYRTYNHINARVKTLLSNAMGSDYTTYKVDAFITGLLAGSTISENTTSTFKEYETNNNTTVLATPLAAATDVKLTVKMATALTNYSLEQIKTLSSVVNEKVFTVKHTNTNYDYAYDYTAKTNGFFGIGAKPAKFKHTFYYYYNYSSYSVSNGSAVETATLLSSASTLETYKDYFTADLATLVSKGNTTLASVKTAVGNAKTNVVSKYGSVVFNHFFPNYNVDTLNTNINNATTVNNYIGIARDIVNLTAEDFTGYSYDQLNTLYSTLQQKINNYKPNNTTADAYIVAQTGLNLTTSNARLVAIDKEMQLIKIRELKPVIDGHMANFNAYTTEQIDEGTLTTGDIGAALTTIKGDKTKLDGYTRSYVDEVCGSDYYSKINSCIDHLNSLATVAGYNDQFSAKYNEYLENIQAKTDITLNDKDLLAGLEEFDGWYTELKTLLRTMEAALGAELATALYDDLDTFMKNNLDAAYAALKTKVETQVDDAYALFTAFLATYPNGAVDFKNVSQFSAMKYSIGLINVGAYEFLPTAQNGLSFSAETVRKYNELQRTFPDFDEFVASMGFSEFETTDIEKIVRPDTIEDVARKNENGEYVVDDAKVLEVIGKLEALLQNPAIKELLGKLINKDKETGEWTGEAFDIGNMIKTLIKDGLFTDSFINTVVGMLYPLVVTEFIKVWANDLPPTFHLDAITIFEIFSYKVGIGAQDPTINYKKNLHTVLKESPFNVFPDLLASALDSKYQHNKDLLNKAMTQFNSEFGATGSDYYTLQLIDEYKDDGTQKKGAKNTPWDSAVLKKDKLDENGDPVIDPETGKVVKTSEWAFTWGVDDKKAELLEDGEFSATDEDAFEEFFYQAFDDAVEGLKPLLYALISNRAWGSSEVKYMAGLTVTNVTVVNTLAIDVHLTLGATANRGYANLLVPVYEALGLSSTEFTAPATVEGYSANANGVAQTLRAIITPIFTFADKLGDNPLNILLGILPDICYVLATQSVPKLLDMLRTSITYNGVPWTTINLLGSHDVNIGDLAGVSVSGGADISVGSMLNLKDMGVDLTDGLNSVLAGFGLNLPALDQGKIATLGTLTTIDTQRAECIYTAPEAGKAYHITANKADVLLYILDWALGNLNGLLSTFGLDLGNAGEFITALTENPDLLIAAIAEMLTMEEYDTLRAYEWLDKTWKDAENNNLVGNSAANIYLNPNNDWTEAKAQYLYNNLDTIVGAILTMAGLDLDKETEGVQADLGEFIGGAIDGLLSDKTLTALAGLLAKLDLNALLAPKAEEEATPENGETPDASEPETVEESDEVEEDDDATTPAIDIDINALVNSLLGIDLAAVAADYADIAAKLEADETYVHNFGVDSGDKTFAEVLATMLEPLSAVLDFILKGTDLVIENGNKDIVLHGYNGYNNAIIPLLEALGCNVVASADLGETSELEATLTALLSKIDAIVNGDTVKGIIDILPGVLYFIASKGLSVTVRNLLQPVYVILDTIRPIYDVNLAELINGLLPDDFGMTINFDDIGIEFIFDLLENLLLKEVDLGTLLDDLKALIYDVCYITATEYDSASDFQTNWKKGAYSDAFSQADLITVVLSFLLDWASDAENAATLDELLGTDGIVASIVSILDTDVEITYDDPNWMYWFNGDEAAFEAYLADPSRINTLATLDWDNVDGDWDKDTAKYFADNIGELVDKIIGMLEINGKKHESVSVLLNDLVNGNLGEYFTAETINTLIGYISGVLANVDDTLLNVGYELLGVNLVALKNYKCEAEIKDLASFVAELARILDSYAKPVVDLLFFGDDIRLAKKPGAEGPVDTIVINGGLGYEKGLGIILEALGCDVPDADKATATNVLKSLTDRVDEILANPVDEILDLLPNLIYALNANAAGVAVNNLLKPVNALLDKINGLGLLENEININELLTVEIGGEEVELLKNLKLANVVEIIEGATDLPLDAAEAILVNFCTGKITEGKFGYKMAAAREDVITIILYVALELISDDAFAAKLDEMLGTDFIAGIKGIFAPSEIKYKAPNWNYMNGIENEGVIEYVNAITSYPNDWTEAKAEYLAENLPALVDTVIGMLEINGKKYESLKALLSELLADSNIFTTKTLEDLLGLINNFLGDIDEELLKLGFILDVKLDKLVKYEVKKDIDTVEEFAKELAYILGEFAPGVVEWLLLGRDFKLLVKDADGIGTGLEGAPYITINGAKGYTEGLALLLEALGCENLPAADSKTEDIVTGVLTSLAARIDEILENPVNEILDLLPNLIYFLEADGVEAVIKNTTAALNALIAKLSVFGIELDIMSLVDLPKLMGIADKYEDGEAKIGLDNLTITALLRAVSLMTGLDLTELQNVLVPFAIGEAVLVKDSVSKNDTYKMVYKTDLDKHDMLSVIVTAALKVVVENEGNAAKLDELLKTDGIVSALKDVFADIAITYETPDWNYAAAANGTVDAMKYSIEYPNNWTEETAQYVTSVLESAEFDALIAGLIEGGKYDSLSALLKDKVNVFTSENLQTVVDTITKLLAGIDDGLLNAAGVLLGADVASLKKYTVPAGITTVDAFASELANVLNTYAKGLVEWFLLGNDYRFFVKEVNNGAPVDFIVINGAKGYANGLALLLEALGCENLPKLDGSETTEEIVTAVLTSLAARINEIFANPIVEVLELLPNLFYFLNANGVSAVVNNTLAAITALLDKLAVFGIDVDIKALVDLKSLMGLKDTDAAISLDNLSMAAVLEAVGMLVGLDLTKAENVLVGFALGKFDENYKSVSDAEVVGTAKKMVYADEFDKHDLVTVVANLALLVLADEANAEFVKGLVGEDIYAVIVNILNVDSFVPDVLNMNWQFTSEETGGDKVGESITAIKTSDLFKNFTYGPNFTKEMADYIAANFGTFVDNIIYLLGIEMNGETYESLSEILKELVGENVYNSANVIAIRDAIAGLLEGIATLKVNDIDLGGYIVEVLKSSLDVDITAVAKVDVPEFTKDKDQFVQYLAEVLAPLSTVLKWLLTDEDIAFFVKEGKTDLIKLPGAEGYKTGLVLLLEALGCKDIVAPEALKDMTGAEMVIAIIDPLLNKVNKILDDPAEELLAVLPNLIYFINSNGVDVVVKNTLNAVCTLLEAISPIADINLDELIYGLVGLSLDELTTEKLIEMLLKDFELAGFKFTGIEVNDIIGELSVGVLENYDSLSHEDPAYRMVYDKKSGSADEGDMVTVLLRFIIKFISTDNNKAVLVDLLKSLGMGADAEKYVTGIFEFLITCIADTKLGMDTALYSIYRIYYGVDLGAEEIATGKRDLDAKWKEKLTELGYTDEIGKDSVGNMITDIFDIIFNDEGKIPEGGGNDVIDDDEIAPNGFLAFFARIKAFFQEIADFFKNLFSFGK